MHLQAQLAAWGTLLLAGMMCQEDYLQGLHGLFLAEPENEMLQRLENCTANPKETIVLLLSALDPDDSAQKSAYARMILEPLGMYYRRADLSIGTFARLAEALWRAIPRVIADEEPFVLLSTAADWLDPDAGCEAAARECYERALRFCSKEDAHERL